MSIKLAAYSCLVDISAADRGRLSMVVAFNAPENFIVCTTGRYLWSSPQVTYSVATVREGME